MSQRFLAVLLVALLGGVPGCGQGNDDGALERGNRSLAEKRYPAAIVEYRKALERDRDNPEATANLAVAYYESGDLEKARPLLVEAAARESGGDAVQVKLAALELRAGRPEQARAAALKVLGRSPSDLEALLVLAAAAGGLEAPCRALVGPWGHSYPQEAGIGPAIGFLQEIERFWKRSLGGEDGGPDTEPAYRVWMRESVAADPDGRDRPGRWVAESRWPSPRIAPRAFRLGRGSLGGPGAAAELRIASPQTAGRSAGSWLVDSFRDQREDDAESLCFDSEPLGERLEILGAPLLRLVVASDRPVAFVVARLCDVSPDGRSTRVSYGMRNLTHGDRHESWAPLEPGKPLQVDAQLRDVAYSFAPGHRLRLALSTACWPLVWPSPEPATLKVLTAGSELRLPVRPPDPADLELRPFAPPEQARSFDWIPLTRSERQRHTETDPATGDRITRSRSGFDAQGNVALSRCEPVGMDGGDGVTIETAIHPEDPLRARASMTQRTELRRGAWSVAIETEVALSCTRSEFRLVARLLAFEAGAPIFERRWDERVPRRGA